MFSDFAKLSTTSEKVVSSNKHIKVLNYKQRNIFLKKQEKRVIKTVNLQPD